MGRSGFLPSGRMRITELVVWDCALAFLVVGLLVADTVLFPVAKTDSAQTANTDTPKDAKPKDAKPKDAKPKDAKSGRRRARRSRRGRSTRKPDTSAGDPLKPLQAEALGSDDAAEALAVLARAKAHKDEPSYAMFRAEVLDHVSRLDAVPALMPQAQHLADRRAVSELDALIGGLPASLDRSPLEAEAKLAKRAAPASGRVKTFRPGWSTRDGTRVKLASDLSESEAGKVLRALDAVLEVAVRLSDGELPDVSFTLEVDPAAALPAPATLRRADESFDALIDRARWALGAHLAERWKLSGPLASGVTAFLAGAKDSRAAPTASAQRWARLLQTRGLKGDGEAVLSVQSGEGDWLLAWGWVRFAASDGSAEAQRARKDLQASLKQGGRLSTWDASRAAAAEQAWLDSLEAP